MTAGELQAVKDFATNLADKVVPEFLQAELAKLPTADVAAAQLIYAALEPALQSMLDAEIAKIS